MYNFFKYNFKVEDGVNQLIDEMLNDNRKQKHVEMLIDNLEKER